MTDTTPDEAAGTPAADVTPDTTPSARLRSTLDEVADLAKAGAARGKLTAAIDDARSAAADLDIAHAEALSAASSKLDGAPAKVAELEEVVRDQARQVQAAERRAANAERARDAAEDETSGYAQRVRELSDQLADRPTPSEGGLTGDVDRAPDGGPELLGLVDVGGTVYSMPEPTDEPRY